MSMDNIGSQYEPVADFYAGKSVFLTGATGFLGKVYVEKLIYTCSKIDKIYILVRHKKGISVSQRMEKYFDPPIFNRIKSERPGDLDKVVPIAGDITSPNLGISPEDEITLTEKVSIIIHSAATIKFNEPLKEALHVNVEATRKLLELSKRMKNIKVFVYVSTAYSNTNQMDMIEEKLYPPPRDIDEAHQFAERKYLYGGNDKKLMKFLNGHPNTYTFTKALAEHLVVEMHGDMPAVIVRPSLVAAAYKEPIEGWIDSFCGVTGIIALSAKGANRVFYIQNEVPVDIIPLDFVSNFTLIAAARCKRSQVVPIYNVCSSAINPLSLRQLFDTAVEYYHKLNEKQIPFPTLYMTESQWSTKVLAFLFETCPCFAADLWLISHGKQKKYMKFHSKVLKVREVMDKCHSRMVKMSSSKAQALFTSLSPEDQQTFYCDLSQIDWNTYLPIYFDGIHNYLLKNIKI